MSLEQITEKLKKGGEWLGAARSWMQWNVNGGDRLPWSTAQPVSIPFCRLEDFALTVAAAAAKEERERLIEALLATDSPNDFMDLIDNDLCGIPCWHEEKLREFLNA